jgi:RNA polymerase sigma-70 factor, ECF subfamily
VKTANNKPIASAKATITAKYYRDCADENDRYLAQLIGQIANGDRMAFKNLYDLVGGQLLRVVRNILRNGTEADDAVQETLLRIWRHAGRYDAERGKPMAWMGTIARNAAFDLSKTTRVVVDDSVLESLEFATQPQDPPDAKLARCLLLLPPEQARAIVLIYTYGLTHTELASLLRVPLGTVKSWVKRGTAQLRVHLLDEI